MSPDPSLPPSDEVIQSLPTMAADSYRAAPTATFHMGLSREAKDTDSEALGHAFEDEVHLRQRAMLTGDVPSFSTHQWCKTMAAHLLHPLSLLWVWPQLGTNGVQNIQLWPLKAHHRARGPANWIVYPFGACCQWTLYGFNVLMVLEGVAVLTAHALLLWMLASGDEHERKCVAFVWPSLIIADCWCIMRYAVISIKYALMSQADRETFLNGSFASSSFMMAQFQLLSSWQSLNVALLVSEVHRLRCKLRQSALCPDAPLFLSSTASKRIRSRLHYDTGRLGLDWRRYRAHLGRGVVIKRRQLEALVHAALVYAQPTHGLVGHVCCKNTLPTAMLLLTLVASFFIPFSAPISLPEQTGGHEGAIWMVLPGRCACGPSNSCPDALAVCRCVEVTPTALALLALLLPIIVRNTLVSLFFMRVAVTDAARRYRSLKAWGGTLRADGWPTAKEGSTEDLNASLWEEAKRVSDEDHSEIEEEEAGGLGPGGGAPPAAEDGHVGAPPPSPPASPPHDRGGKGAVDVLADEVHVAEGSVEEASPHARGANDGGGHDGVGVVVVGGGDGAADGTGGDVSSRSTGASRGGKWRKMSVLSAPVREVRQRSTSRDFDKLNAEYGASAADAADFALPEVAPPLLDHTQPDNLLSWMVGRTLVYRYGERCVAWARARKPRGTWPAHARHGRSGHHAAGLHGTAAREPRDRRVTAVQVQGAHRALFVDVHGHRTGRNGRRRLVPLLHRACAGTKLWRHVDAKSGPSCDESCGHFCTKLKALRDAPALRRQVSLQLVYHALVLLVSLFAPLLFATLLLVRANGQNGEDRLTLCELRHGMLQSLGHARAGEAGRYRRCVEIIDHLLGHLREQDEQARHAPAAAQQLTVAAPLTPRCPSPTPRLSSLDDRCLSQSSTSPPPPPYSPPSPPSSVSPCRSLASIWWKFSRCCTSSPTRPRQRPSPASTSPSLAEAERRRF